MDGLSYDGVKYRTEGRVAYITLSRPARLNAIDALMPAAIHRAVDLANADPAVHVIVVEGEGAGFCAGYDLQEYAQAEPGVSRPGSQTGSWDPYLDYHLMKRNTDDFMSLWYSLKPTVCKVQGYAVAGGSDIALCCDIVVMEETAKIGYPPARVWGSPSTQMWVYRVGAERAKRMLLTGDLITGREAAAIGLVSQAVPREELVGTVARLVQRMASVPKNQLMMNKLVVNQAYENMGLRSTQTLATLFDGISRHSPEGRQFKEMAERDGFKAAVRHRDSGEPLGSDEQLGVAQQLHELQRQRSRLYARL